MEQKSIFFRRSTASFWNTRLTLTVSSVMFLSILVAAYWFSRCRKTWERREEAKQAELKQSSSVRIA